MTSIEEVLGELLCLVGLGRVVGFCRLEERLASIPGKDMESWKNDSQLRLAYQKRKHEAHHPTVTLKWAKGTGLRDLEATLPRGLPSSSIKAPKLSTLLHS